ncbi:MAG TPA: hypothetical protein ENN33_04275 [Ignavibacteria bacterium]|nr:hypothetical protein [Ignavibacteria bacterium]
MIYRVIEKRVFIYRILDGSRDFSKLLEERLLRE